jgi:hypothetical protein
MSGPSVHARHPQAVGALHEFCTRFCGVRIAETEDAQEDLVLVHVGAAEKIFAVSAEFLNNLGPPEIHKKLAASNVVHLSRTLERNCEPDHNRAAISSQ